jgi:ferredoxin
LKKKIRLYTQGFFFIFVALIAINHTLAEKNIIIPFIPTASLHAICPFGGVETLYNFLLDGKLLPKLHESTFIITGIILLISLLFGSVFCGWICPLGTIQEWIGKIGRKLFKKKYNNFISPSIHKILSFGPFIILALVLYTTISTAKLAFLDFDPYYALFSFWTGEVALYSILILVVILGASLFIERPWCQYLCPFGIILGFTNKFRLFNLKRNTDTCISCKLCDKNCPMNLNISTSTKISSIKCISCMECTSENTCPKENTLIITSGKMNLSKKFIPIFIIVFLFGGVQITSYLSLWKTERSAEPAKLTTSDNVIQYDPADIRGSHSFKEISQLYGIEEKHLIEGFKLSDISVKIKDLETIYADSQVEIGTKSVRYFVALYNNIPYDKGDEEVYLPSSAVDLLLAIKTLDSNEINYLETHKTK